LKSNIEKLDLISQEKITGSVVER